MIALDVEIFDEQEYDRLAAQANAVYRLLELNSIPIWLDPFKEIIRKAMAYQVQVQVVDSKAGLVRIVGLVALEEGVDYHFGYKDGKPVVLEAGVESDPPPVMFCGVCLAPRYPNGECSENKEHAG